MFNGMHLITSFTGSRGVRYPSPDVARGFMLLLISLANITFWTGVARVSAPNDAADTAWLWVRTLLIDARSYPLFAMLFGFGLVTMVDRRIASGTQSYLQSLPGVDADREPTPQEEAWAREQATVDARRLVRRRGAWMILFGFVHGIFFVGDIIGVYGLVAVVFAGWLSRKRYTALCIVGVVIAVVVVCAYMAIDLFAPEMAAQMSGEQTSLTPTTLPWFVVNISSWIYALFAQFLITLIVPAAVIGARLADTGIIIHPELHRGLLAAMGIGGLTLGVGGALHSALTKVMSISAWPWDFAAKEVFGLAGACGWLALLALYAGGPREDGRLTGLRKLGLLRGAPLHDRLPESDDSVRVPLRHRPPSGDGGASVAGAGRGCPGCRGGLAGDGRPVRCLGTRWACRSFRDPAAHRRGPQRAQTGDGGAAGRPAR